MKDKGGLHIPKSMLVYASGINEKIINKDIENGIIMVKNNDYIWYRDAITYVFKKWEEGNTEMYPPFGGEVDDGFSTRVLSIIDDVIASEDLDLNWKNHK